MGQPVSEGAFGLADVHASLQVFPIGEAGGDDHDVVAIHQAVLYQHRLQLS
jgi:hypothetical protein